MTTDITSLDSSNQNTFDVPVVFDDNGDEVSGFKVVGKNSIEYRAARRAQEVVGIKRASVRGGKQPDAKTDAGAAYYLDYAAENEVGIAIACVTGWYGFAKDGAEIPLTAEALASVFAKRPTWREKVSAAIEVDANFTKA